MRYDTLDSLLALKMKFFLMGWFVVFGIFANVHLLVAEKDTPPTDEIGKRTPNLFQAILWQGTADERLVYAPWGNATEENATLLDITLQNSSLCEKFAYYGESPLTLYKLKKSDSSSLKTIQPVAQYRFNYGKEAQKEEILVVTGDSKSGLKIYAFPFELYTVPMGSFYFKSLSKEATYFKLGSEKFALPPGKAKLVLPKQEPKQKNRKLEGFLLRDNQYKSSHVRLVPARSSIRSLVLITTKGANIEPFLIFDFNGNQKINTVLGYDSLTHTHL
jgi:hypothetical protein